MTHTKMTRIKDLADEAMKKISSAKDMSAQPRWRVDASNLFEAAFCYERAASLEKQNALVQKQLRDRAADIGYQMRDPIVSSVLRQARELHHGSCMTDDPHATDEALGGAGGAWSCSSRTL